MRKRNWNSLIAAALGLACSAVARADAPILNAEAVFSNSAPGWVSPVNCEAACAPGDECAAAAACDGGGCGGGGCCGGELGDPWDLSDSLHERMGCEDCPWDVGGWTSVGYHNKSDGIFNTYPDHVQLHQANIFVEKATDGADGLDIGGRMDVMYGTDAQNTQSFGNTPGVFDFNNDFRHGAYGWAIPQLYAEAAYHDWKVKLGHFYTLIGYEVVPSTGNFFYSHAFTMNFSEPFTHTGALATYSASDDVTLYGGWTLGWDTGFDQRNGGNNGIGGASVKVTDNMTATYVLTAGNFGWIGHGYSHSIVMDFAISDNWQYVLQSDLVNTNVDPFGVRQDYHTIGINQYLFYTVSDRTKVGVRGEWWKAQGISIYDVTAGVNFRPMANLVIRPEWRYRWSPSLNNSAVDDAAFNFEEGIFGVDAVLTF